MTGTPFLASLRKGYASRQRPKGGRRPCPLGDAGALRASTAARDRKAAAGRARCEKEATGIDGKARDPPSPKQVAKGLNRHERQKIAPQGPAGRRRAQKNLRSRRGNGGATCRPQRRRWRKALSAMRYCGKAGLIMLRQPRPRLTGKVTPASTCRRSRTRRYWLRRLSRRFCSSQPRRGRASEGVLAL